MDVVEETPKLLGWLGGCDGPSVFLPGEILTAWEGTDPPSGGRVVDARFRWSLQEDEPACDYDKACDASDAEFGTVFPFSGFSVFVSQGGEQVAIVKSTHPEPILLLGSYGWEEELDGSSIIKLRMRILPENWKKIGEMAVGVSGKVYYFHAASSGSDDWEDSLEDSGFIDVPMGTYSIYASRLSPEKFFVRWENDIK